MITTSRIDLHLHTHFSDGCYSPEKVVRIAFHRGVAAIAITDHDTTAGLEEARQSGIRHGIEIINGVEISAICDDGLLHFLGYFIDPDDQNLQKSLSEYVKARNLRNPLILEKLKHYGYVLEMEEVQELAKGNIINRPHIAQAMIKKGYVRSSHEAFERFLAVGAAAYVPKEIFSAEEAIRIIHEAGGLAVLAHPDQLYGGNIEKITNVIYSYAEMGLDGIETYHGKGFPQHSPYYEQIAKEKDMLITGGSDFHGNQKQNTIGEVNGIDYVPYRLLDDMKQRREMKFKSAVGI